MLKIQSLSFHDPHSQSTISSSADGHRASNRRQLELFLGAFTMEHKDQLDKQTATSTWNIV